MASFMEDVLTSPLLVGQLFEYGALLSPLNNVHKASSDLCDVIVLRCMVHPMAQNGI